MNIAELLAIYNSLYQHHFSLKQQKTWESVTGKLHESDTSLELATSALDGVTLNPEITSRILSLARNSKLSHLEQRQVQKVSQYLGQGSLVETTLTPKKVRLERLARETLVNHQYTFDGRPVSQSFLKDILKKSQSLPERKLAWEGLQAVGAPLARFASELRDVRNEFARKAGYKNYLDIQVEDYGFNSEQLYDWLTKEVKSTDKIYEKMSEIYLESLDEKYGNISKLEAHLFTDQWSQSWKNFHGDLSAIDKFFEQMPVDWFISEASKYWASIGFDALPKSFYAKSDLYPSHGRNKLGGASMWHIDLRKDIRGLMSIVPNSYWFGAVHHELGHYYYYDAYSNDSVPPLLRVGLNRAMHEAIGDLIRLDCFQYANLKRLGIQLKPEDTKKLILREAFQEGVPLLRFSLGAVLSFEYDIYVNELEFADWQTAWWKHVASFQGISPPSIRPKDGCDAFSKRHLTLTPGYYFNYGLSTIIKYQLHDYICSNILKEDPLEASFFNNKDVGEFLFEIMKIGGAEDWSRAYERLLGAQLSSSALIKRFENILPH